MTPEQYLRLCAALEDECRDLIGRMADIDPRRWNMSTPAPGWTVADQVTHLGIGDHVTVEAFTDPAAFDQRKREFLADPSLTERTLVDRAGLGAEQRLRWLGEQNGALLTVLRASSPEVVIPWMGPPLRASSATRARIMEYWSHGQDIVDALGMQRHASDRLYYVAHIGVQTIGHSFRTAGRPVPTGEVRVELAAPGGGLWTWGPERSADSVRGPAVGFCLAVTQRRHLSDCGLDVEGPVATTWMTVAQAFAGPRGQGRQPGQFDQGSAT